VRARWAIVLISAAAVVLTSLVVKVLPAARSDISAVELAKRVQASAPVAWSGFVETAGTLDVPDSDSFANLAQLLGETNRMRVWWRAADDWRVDRIRSTGENDLFRNGNVSIRWVFESETATIAPVSKVRLPDSADLLPPTLGRSMVQGARDDELSRLPSRRVAGVDAVGLLLVPDQTSTTIGHVDIWADPHSGLPLEVELYGVDDRRAVLSTTLRELDIGVPPAEITKFSRPPGVQVTYDQSVDAAAAANAFAPGDLPGSLAGLNSRDGEDPSAVGIYGRGPTTLIALPLRRDVARPLRERLRDSGAGQETEVGTVTSVGPVGLLVTSYRRDGSRFLLAGTVTADTLRLAATDLLGRP